MTIDKRKIFPLLFLLYFVVYAASPIIYTVTCENPYGNIRARAGSASLVDSFQIFLWEAVWGKQVSGEDTTSDNSSLKVLIKKKRAILPENPVAKLLHPDHLFLSEEMPSVSTSFVAGYAGPDDSSADSRDRHIPYRGHSPPSLFPFS